MLLLGTNVVYETKKVFGFHIRSFGCIVINSDTSFFVFNLNNSGSYVKCIDACCVNIPLK